MSLRMARRRPCDSFLVSPMIQDRPAGVTAIVALCVTLAVISLVFAALIVAGQLSLSAGAFLLAGGFEQLGPLAFLLYAAVLVMLGLDWENAGTGCAAREFFWLLRE